MSTRYNEYSRQRSGKYPNTPSPTVRSSNTPVSNVIGSGRRGTNAIRDVNELIHTDFSCKYVSYWLDESLKIIMQVFLVVTFLSLFFFLYVTTAEEEIFVNQINFVVDSMYQDFQSNMSKIVPPQGQSYLKQEILDIVNTYQPDNDTYASIKAQNQTVINQTKQIVLLVGIILFSLIVSLMMLRFCTDLTHQFFENVLVLFFLGMTEFLFLNLVTRNFLAVNPNSIKFYILSTIQKYAETRN